MSLHRLPPELLLNILRLLGSAFFHQDVRRLLVSKWWYQIAWPVFLQDLEFRAETLRSFILASERVGMVRSIQEYVITATLVLDGFENWDSAHSTVTATELSEIDFEIVNMWTSQLNGYAAAFAGILQQCTRLQRLRLEARPERHDPRLCLQRRDYLMAAPLASPINDSKTTRVHLCSKISTMLLTLRRLRCRMSSICPFIFNVPRSGLLLNIEEVIINLSLSETCGSDTSYRYPSRCGFNTSDTFPQLKADMESSARELVFAMQSPRIVRILSHTFPGLALRSFDVLTERQMVLTPAAPWDADGEEVEDRVSTEDRFDSDSSSEEFLL